MRWRSCKAVFIAAGLLLIICCRPGRGAVVYECEVFDGAGGTGAGGASTGVIAIAQGSAIGTIENGNLQMLAGFIGCMVTPSAPGPTGFGITNEIVGGVNNVLHVGDGSATRIYLIITGDGDGGVPRTLSFAVTNPPGGAFSFTDSGVVSDGSVTSRYYQVVEDNQVATVTTNPTVWVL